MQKPEAPETQSMKLSDITPYEGNPRKISPEAIEAVRKSIDEFGYVQPIVVDPAGVIVAGHTRYEALKSLGREETDVIVARLSDKKLQQYRLADNRAGELSSWDMDALVLEVREWETDLLEDFFPDIDLEIGQIEDAQTTNEDVERAAERATTVSVGTSPMVAVDCPDCGETFEVRASSLPGITDDDVRTLRREG